MTTHAQGLDGVERVLASLGKRLNVVDVEGIRGKRGVLLVAEVVLADAHAFSFLRRPRMSFYAADFES